MAGLTWRRELGERLVHAWCRAQQGGGQVVVVVGDPGMGKTTMLSWLAEHIGTAARTVTCRGGDAAPALSTAIDVATGLPQPIRARMRRRGGWPMAAVMLVAYAGYIVVQAGL